MIIKKPCYSKDIKVHVFIWWHIKSCLFSYKMNKNQDFLSLLEYCSGGTFPWYTSIQICWVRVLVTRKEFPYIAVSKSRASCGWLYIRHSYIISTLKQTFSTLLLPVSRAEVIFWRKVSLHWLKPWASAVMERG